MKAQDRTVIKSDMTRTTETASPSSAPHLIRALAHLCLAGATGLFLFAAVRTAGIDIIMIYLRTSRFNYPVLLFSLCGFFIMVNIIMAVRSIAAFKKKRPSTGTRAAVGLILSMVVVFIYLADPFLRMYHPPADPERASARKRLWARIGPVVQFGPFAGRKTDASTSMVLWYFDPVMNNGPATARFGIGPLPEKMSAVYEASGDGRRHEFHFTGLSPDTVYYYQIPAWGDTVRSFRTAPARSAGGSFRFFALGDTDSSRIGGYAFSYFRNVLRAAMTAYHDQGRRPSFMVHAGDMVRTGADLDAWHNHFSSLAMMDSMPVAAAAGNHDFLMDGGANFRYLYGQPDYYAVDYGAARIFFIHPFDGPGTTLDGPVITTGAEQYRWICRELARSGPKWLIIVIHTPILSTGDYGVNELLAAQYVELFRKRRVDLVISGHDHNFDSYHVDSASPWGGTIYIVTGTGGSALDSHIMERPERRWKNWRHDGTSPLGLFQNDRFTSAYHRYGELSWGFTDVEIRGDALTVSFYRWLDLDTFFRITGLDRRRWNMMYLDDRTLARHDLLRAKVIKRIDKKQPPMH